MDSRKWFRLACAAESALAVVGWGAAWLMGQDVGRWFPCRAADFGLGLATALPLWAGFWLSLRAASPAFVRIRRLLEERLAPWFRPWSLAQLALVSLLAGIGEELFFRGALQGGLARWLGTPAAVVVASAAFGLCHAVTPAYAVVAAAIGAGLGALFVATGSLTAPVVAHAIYDFGALVYFLRVHLPPVPGPRS